MKTITVKTKSNQWTTDINGTKKEIESYYLGKSFNIGYYPDKEVFETVTEVIFHNYSTIDKLEDACNDFFKSKVIVVTPLLYGLYYLQVKDQKEDINVFDNKELQDVLEKIGFKEYFSISKNLARVKI